jgi:hypothetical protein
MRRVLLSCAALLPLSGTANAAAPSFFSIGDLLGGAVDERPFAVVRSLNGRGRNVICLVVKSGEA